MLDKICTDLETSKELKELELKEKTIFYWKNMFSERNGYKEPQLQMLTEGDNIVNDLFIPAYTLEQIWEILPNRIRLRSDKYPDRFFKYTLKIDMTNLKIYYQCSSEVKYFINIDYNLATTAGRLLIKLYEDGIIKDEKGR